MGDAAKQAKAQYCTERQRVNTEVTGLKAYILTLRDLILIWRRYGRVPSGNGCQTQRMASRYYQKSAEVIVILKRAASQTQGHTAEVSKKGEGLNVRKARNLAELMKQRKQQKRIRALLV